ncbi:MAG: HsmA family protein [Ignavibacteriota bacterium]|nr:HsmA family protein [Ignavibacteriota bacterium]
MPLLTISAILLISLALVFYSIGIWSERYSRYLKTWHVVCFWLGLLFDISGTYTMHLISTKEFNILEPHTLTGQLALWVMLVHVIWATYVNKWGSEKTHRKFHVYSIHVWMLWMVPYLGGMYLAMKR